MPVGAPRSRLRVWLCGAMLGSTLSLAASSVASAWCRTTTVQAPERYDNCWLEADTPCWAEGIPLAWIRACIPYKVSPRAAVDPATGETTLPRDDLPYERVLEIVEESFGTWTGVECDGLPLGLRTKRIANKTADYDSWFEEEDLSGMNAVSFVNDWDERGNAAVIFALTEVFSNTSSGEILWVNMKLNEQYGNWGDCCPSGVCSEKDATRCHTRRTVDLQNVITHEAGHFIGLAHECALRDATMYYAADRGQTNKRTLEADDREGICNIYPPGSLPEGCDFSPYKSALPTASCGCRAAGAGGSLLALRTTLAGLASLLALLAARCRARKRSAREGGLEQRTG